MTFLVGESIPILKKLLSFIDIRFLITFNDFSSRSINTHSSKFFYAFPKDLKRLFDRVKPIRIYRGKSLTLNLSAL